MSRIEEDGTPRRWQRDAVFDLGVSSHELAQGILADPRAGEVMHVAQRLRGEDAGFDGIETRTVVDDGAELRVDGLDARVEGVRRGHACRLRRIVGARVVDDRLDSTLLDRLREFRSEQRIGLRDAIRRACGHARDHREEEDGHQREHYDGDDVDLLRAIRLLARLVLLVVL